MTWSVRFFFNDTATTEIYTLSLHDALPIWAARRRRDGARGASVDTTSTAPRGSHPAGVPQTAGPATPEERPGRLAGRGDPRRRDRKSTRLNSSHANISYAVFCLKKKKQ